MFEIGLTCLIVCVCAGYDKDHYLHPSLSNSSAAVPLPPPPVSSEKSTLKCQILPQIANWMLFQVCLIISLLVILVFGQNKVIFSVLVNFRHTFF